MKSILVSVIGLIFFLSFFLGHYHVPNSGQHSGYVSSVEKSGIIWKTWTAYVKTDPQSSQEDTYCVTDSSVVNQLKMASENRISVTVNYSVPIIVWKWECGNEQSIIQSLNVSHSVVSNYASITDSPTSPSISGTTLLDDPTRYGVTITQTGGIDSHVISTTVDRWDMLASSQYCSGYSWSFGFCFSYLKPAENYMSTKFYNAGDLSSFGGEPDWVGTSSSMTAYCKIGYIVTHASSPTNNPIDTYFMGVPGYGVGIKILNQMNNTIYIVCEKQKQSS